ncbi:MAG: hypothetical protein EXR98_11840 [Gemmataceae bacterium]|nr:hypothetical protein [Gemmataceae bacterium]
MLQRNRFLALAVLVSALCVSAAPAQTTLRYQFKEGEKLPYVMEQKMKMLMSIMGMDIETKMNMTMELSLNVLELTKDGGAKMQFKVSHAKMSMDAVTGKVDVDSKDKDEPDDQVGKILSGVVKALGAMEMSGTMLASGEMKDIQVSEATLKALKALPGADKLGDVTSPDAFKTMVSNLVFPTDAISKGKTWNNKIETKTPFGKGITDNKYTYEGTIQKDGAALEKISVKPDTKIVADPNAQIKITIKDSKGSGHILFDNKKGRIIESITQQTTEMAISANGLDLTQTVQQTTTLRLKKQ